MVVDKMDEILKLILGGIKWRGICLSRLKTLMNVSPLKVSGSVFVFVPLKFSGLSEFDIHPLSRGDSL